MDNKELHIIWWQNLDVNSRFTIMKRYSVVKVSDKLIKQLYQLELLTVNDVWLSKIEEATKKDLIRFIFKFHEEYYCSEWHKAKWDEPFKMQFL